MSFLTLGIFWNGQQTPLDRLARADHQFTSDPPGVSLRHNLEAVLD
jgi:hypothetical protein